MSVFLALADYSWCCWFESMNVTVGPIYGRWMTSDPPQVGGGMGGIPPLRGGPKRVLGNQPFFYKRGTHWEGR